MKEVNIDGKSIGLNHKPYIIAELSANHNGSLERALQTLEAIAASGADAIKIQTYTPDSMTIDCDKQDFTIKGGLWDGYKLYDLYKEAHTPFEWHEALFDKAKTLNTTIFSTPFDESAVVLLEKLNTPAYKIASFEAVDLRLIKCVARTGKPVIISTGMANLTEIDDAVKTARDNGCQELILMHCISNYPASAEQSGLNTVQDLAMRFDCVTGLSDHTPGTAVSTAAVALDACVIEKHVTLSRSEKGPDSEFSLEPDELKTLCDDTQTAWEAKGVVNYEHRQPEEANMGFRRSIYFVKGIKAGDRVGPEHVRAIRPGYGLPPKCQNQLIGKKVKQDIARGTATRWEQFESHTRSRK